MRYLSQPEEGYDGQEMYNYLLAAHRSERVRNKQLQINTFYDQSFDLKLTTRYLAIIYYMAK